MREEILELSCKIADAARLRHVSTQLSHVCAGYCGGNDTMRYYLMMG